MRSKDKNRSKDKKHAFSPHSLPLPIATHRDVEKAEITFRVGAVLKKIKFLGCKDPGLKVRPLKERGCPVVVFEGEGVTHLTF